MSRRRFVAAGLLGAFAVAPARLWAQTTDPRLLIGNWEGTWQGRVGDQSGLSGQYFLTIDRVDGNKVFGSGRISGRRTTEFRFVGTLEGNRLAYGKETRVELEVQDASRMQGTSTGSFNSAITLRKKP